MQPARARGKRRAKLAQGFSQIDWAKLSRQAKDLAGTRGAAPRGITLAEVREHNNLRQDAWIVLRGKVYNVSKYVPYHPGGAAELARGIGQDATVLFDEAHAYVSESMLSACEVGWIVDGDPPPGAAPATAADAATPRSRRSSGGSGFLSALARRTSQKRSGSTVAAEAAPARWRGCSVSCAAPTPSAAHCFLVRLQCESALPDDQQALLGQPGTYAELRAKVNGKWYERPFTILPPSAALPGPAPAGSEAAAGGSACWRPRYDGEPAAAPDASRVDLLAKLYADSVVCAALLASAGVAVSSEGPRLPETAPELLLIEVRQSALRVAAREGKMHVGVAGAAGFRKASNAPACVFMVAQGTGVVPMLQLLAWARAARAAGELASLPDMTLLLACRSEAEAPLLQELRALAKAGAGEAEPVLRRLVLAQSAPESGEGARLDAGALAQHVSAAYGGAPEEEIAADPAIRFVVCGSFEFSADVEATLAKAGWPASCVNRIEA